MTSPSACPLIVRVKRKTDDASMSAVLMKRQRKNSNNETDQKIDNGQQFQKFVPLHSSDPNTCDDNQWKMLAAKLPDGLQHKFHVADMIVNDDSTKPNHKRARKDLQLDTIHIVHSGDNCHAISNDSNMPNLHDDIFNTSPPLQTVSKNQPTVSCNGIPAMRINNSANLPSFVYDYFILTEAANGDLCKDFGPCYFQFAELSSQQSMFIGYYGNEENELIHELNDIDNENVQDIDSDSNDEDNWRNDYPDESQESDYDGYDGDEVDHLCEGLERRLKPLYGEEDDWSGKDDLY